MTVLDGVVAPDVSAWLAALLPEAQPPFAAAAISGGFSMLTYRISDAAGGSWVLRAPPAGRAAGRAHDVGREARIMNALRGTSVPVPQVRYVGDGSDPLGVPCHITDYVAGRVLEGHHLDPLPPEAMRTASEEIVDVLARLHSVVPEQAGLGGLGPQTGYVARQLRRWRKQIDSAAPAGDALHAELTGLADRLDTHRFPDTPARVVHGDFRLGNAIVTEDGRVAALLDWELSTLGDPLADLGMLVAFWSPSRDAMLGKVMPTTMPGAISVSTAIDRYARMSDRDIGDLDAYVALACWRLGCAAYMARARYSAGVMNDRIDASVFEASMRGWSAAAHEAFGTVEPRRIVL